MAELISKDGVIKLIEKEFDMNCLTEWGQGYIDAMNDVKGIIALQPTPTEAEIRAKAIDEFAHELKETFNQEFPRDYESTRPYFTLDDVRKLVDLVAEQLKEE